MSLAGRYDAGQRPTSREVRVRSDKETKSDKENKKAARHGHAALIVGIS